jgi:hypothetical protein
MTMLIRGIAALGMLLALLLAPYQDAKAGDKPTHHVSCTLVRFYVAKYSMAAAETWARSRGATDLDIETARHCLGSGVVTASWGG